MADNVQSSSQHREVPLQERFFRYFQSEVIALQEQMSRLADTTLITGERRDATDHCLAGITRLSNEVKDASSYLPTYDQRTYGEAVKALQEKLEETRAAFQPKPKFAFKTKNASAVSLNDAAELAAQHRRGLPGFISPDSFSADSSISTTPAYLQTPPNERYPNSLNLPVPPAPPPIAVAAHAPSPLSGQLPQTSAPTPFSSSSSNSITISNRTNAHLTLPSSTPPQSQSPTPCSIQTLTSCLLDLTSPHSLASLTITSAHTSLLLCHSISGPAHLTSISNSILVISCRQFRMHQCHDVRVYLHCTSRPIIEDCHGISFSNLPKAYVDHLTCTSDSAKEVLSAENRWDQIDDFKWLRAEQSPNWEVLPVEERIEDETWQRVLSRDEDSRLEVAEVLKAVGIRGES